MSNKYCKVTKVSSGSFTVEDKDEFSFIARPDLGVGKFDQIKKKYQIMYSSFLPVMEGDIVYLTYDENKKNDLAITPSKHPLVKMSNMKEDVIKYFFIANPRRKGNPEQTGVITMKQSKNFYEEFEEFYPNPVDQLDKMAECYNSVRSKDVGCFCIPTSSVKRVLKWWYRNRILRRFYLLGLRRNEFSDREGTLVDVYKQIIVNPFRIITLKMESCLNIINIIGLEISDEEQLAGMAIRQVYENVKKKSWSMTPINIVNNVCPNYQNFKHLLMKHYGVVEEYGGVFLPDQRNTEVIVSKFLTTMKEMPIVNLEDEDVRYFDNLTSDQNLAIKTAVQNGVSVLTGYAGTGKTTVIKHLVTVLEENEVDYMLVSFTGKAVSRIREVTGIDKASTFHRLIGSMDEIPKFKVLIIDETSMVTTELFYMFIQRVIRFNGPCNIVMVGDIGQLQPITWGCLMESTIESKRFPITNLTDIMRSDNDINLLALGITKGVVPISAKGNGYKIMNGDVDDIIHLVHQFHQEGLDANEFKIICPLNKYLTDINAKIQSIYTSKNMFYVDAMGNRWNVGDIVSMSVNNYNLGIFNGNEGRITFVDSFKMRVMFFSPEKECEFEHVSESVIEGRKKMDPDDPSIDEIEERASHRLQISYAITVHKSQGSEWKKLIFFCPKGVVSGDFLNKNLVYTGCSRAREELLIVGDFLTFRNSVKTDKSHRFEALSKRLVDCREHYIFDEKVRDIKPDRPDKIGSGASSGPSITEHLVGLTVEKIASEKSERDKIDFARIKAIEKNEEE
jgi:hypothetical protein